tara:strand:+ start:1058 stop:1486 length:429 start_codon:yes stop_codon:yes gene_type:complete
MSSLNINNLYETMDEKNIKRLEKFDDILKQIHGRIKYYARLERTHCFFNVPEFIIGVPLYNVTDLRSYIMNCLNKDGFKILHVEPNWLFISWERHIKKQVVPKQKKKKSEDFKLIDEYKPTGGFVYNENDLLIMQEKSKELS